MPPDNKSASAALDYAEKFDIGHDPAALHEAVPRGELGEDVEPLHDFCRKRAESCCRQPTARGAARSGRPGHESDPGRLLVIMQRPRRRGADPR
jgi:hypothetical protein